jgi:hypothetical protein
MKQSLQRYGHIMSADDHYTRWQEVRQWMVQTNTPSHYSLFFDKTGFSVLRMCHFLNFSMLED